MCQSFSLLSLIIVIFLDKVVELVGGGSVINGATPSSLDLKALLWGIPLPRSGAKLIL